MKEDERKKMLKLLARFGTVGLEMGFSVAVGAFIGMFLDKLLGTKPWLGIIFLLLGVAAGFRRLIQVTRKVKFNDLGNN